MNKLNWKDIILATNTSPDVMEGMRDYISMIGALNIFIPKGRELPERLYDVTSDIETKVRTAFSGLKIVGEESVNTINPEYKRTRYLGHLYGRNISDVILRMQMSGVESIPQLKEDALLTFFAVFPLGNYKRQSEEAIKGIWQHIKGFNYVIPLGRNTDIPQNKQGDQSVLLIKDGVPVASGKYAISESGISLKPKETIMMSDGIMI